MLPKKIRLTTSLFDQVFKTGRIQHGRSFWMRSLTSSPDLFNRYAVTVPKKIAKTAVLRNKIKRIVYRAIETLAVDDLSGKSGSQIIFGLKNDISKIPFAEIVQELKDLQLKKDQK
jgi:ribonuclease P protein component